MNEMIKICISAQLTLEVFFWVVNTVLVMMTTMCVGSNWLIVSLDHRWYHHYGRSVTPVDFAGLGAGSDILAEQAFRPAD